MLQAMRTISSYTAPCLILMAIVASSSAGATSMEACKNTSKITNQYLPQKKDSITTVKSTACFPGNSKNKFIYLLEVSTSLHNAKKVNFGEIKRDVINTLCTDPNTRALINAYDVEYRYYTNDGTFVASYMISSNECF